MKLAARAFYDDYTTKGDNQPKSGRSDNRGIAVVVLDALTRSVYLPFRISTRSSLYLCVLRRYCTDPHSGLESIWILESKVFMGCHCYEIGTEDTDWVTVIVLFKNVVLE